MYYIMKMRLAYYNSLHYTLEKMANIPEIILNSGHHMPVVGFGTASYPFQGSEAAKLAVLEAIKVGYRHFDTASFYQTEQCLGEAIEEALHLGLIKSRSDLFITSKLWCTDGFHDRVLPALQLSLKNLKLDYLDLYLIHWPLSLKLGKNMLPLPEELCAMDFKSVWEAMEECQKLGLTKSIGVSNFSCKKLHHLLSAAKIPPAVDQVEMNPLWQQNKLIEFCKNKGIVVTAYSPLGAKGTMWGSNRVMDCEVIKEIANSKGKAHAQVCLRWVHEQGVALVVKSFNKERIKENLEIFNWELTKEECEKMKQLPQSRGLVPEAFISVDGPFQSLEELWDGEI